MLYAVIKPPVPPSSGCQLQMAAPLIVSAHLLALKFPRRESFLLSSLSILSPRWARGVRTETAISTLRPRYNPYESHWLNCDQSRRDTDVLSAAFMTFWVTHELEKARIWTQIWQKNTPTPQNTYTYVHIHVNTYVYMYMDSWRGCQHYISVDISHFPCITSTPPSLVSRILVPLTKVTEIQETQQGKRIQGHMF